jgi:hypothetical protein
MGLGGNGVFVGNQNKSGIIEIAVLSGTITVGGLQVMELTGIPFPIIATDKATGGTSGFVASACRRVSTPEWRRAKFPNFEIFTYATPSLIISEGIRLTA